MITRALTLLYCCLLFSGQLSAEPLRVVVSVIPLQTFVEQVGGDAVAVQSLVNAGFDPHHFEPTPQQVNQLSNADIFLSIGLPVETVWLQRIHALNPNMPVTALTDASISHPEKEADHEHEIQLHGEHDAHIWTSPAISKQIVRSIEQALIQLAPQQQETFTRNADRYIAQLSELEAEIAAALQPLTQRTFMVMHPGWGYFADQFGLTQLAIEFEGKEPGPRSLTRLINQARQEQIKLVLVQPQFSPRAAEQIARAIDGTVAIADPLAADYIANLRRLTATLVKVNQQ